MARFSSVARIKSVHLETCKLSFFIIGELIDLPVTLEDMKELISQFFHSSASFVTVWARQKHLWFNFIALFKNGKQPPHMMHSELCLCPVSERRTNEKKTSASPLSPFACHKGKWLKPAGEATRPLWCHNTISQMLASKICGTSSTVQSWQEVETLHFNGKLETEG